MTIEMDFTISPQTFSMRDLIMDDPARSLASEPFITPPHEDNSLDALIISDLHLGSDNCQAKPLVRLLESILEGELRVRSLIINGDVFDSIDFRRLKKTHWKVLSLIRHLSDKIEVIWIAGNHDGSADIISHLLGVRVVEEFILTSGSQRILCIHGHRFDDFIDDHPVLTWIGDCIYWMLQKMDRSHRFARMAKKKSKVFVHCVDKIETGAMKLAREFGCGIAVCGHTHVAVSKPAHHPGDISYFNSGCWTERPCNYITVRNGVVSVESDAAVEVSEASIAV